jgi:CRP-like cAMP-binding protein
MADGEQLFARFGKRCPAGTVLFREGEAGEVMYVVQTGRVRISKTGKEGDKTLALLGPGEFFGEMAILNNKPRSATAVVEEDAKLLELDAGTFEQMIVSNAEIAVRLIRKLARRLDAVDGLVDILLHRDPKARVILGLSREAEVNGQLQQDGSVLVPMDRGQLARQFGLDPDEIGSVLARLQRLSIIQETAGGFVVPDRMRLHEFLQFLQNRDQVGDV